MDTMIRTFFRHILESFKSLRRNGWMTISSISAVTITLALLGAFLMIILNTVKLAEDMENNVEVSVFMNHGVTQEEQDELEATLKALPHVESVEFSSQDEELERVKESFGENAENKKLIDNAIIFYIFYLNINKKELIKKDFDDYCKELSLVDYIKNIKFEMAKDNIDFSKNNGISKLESIIKLINSSRDN